MTQVSLFSKNIFKKVLVSGLLEFTPILVFILSYHRFHIYKATFILMLVTVIFTFLTYFFQKRLPYLAIYIAILTVLFGYLTISHHKPSFIQVKDTMYDITCALTLLIGLMINVPFLKLAFQSVIPMTVRAWNKLTYGWILFFITGAILNEYVRRNHSLNTWFEFKGLMVIATSLFAITLLYFVYEKDTHTHME